MGESFQLVEQFVKRNMREAEKISWGTGEWVKSIEEGKQSVGSAFVGCPTVNALVHFTDQIEADEYFPGLFRLFHSFPGSLARNK